MQTRRGSSVAVGRATGPLNRAEIEQIVAVYEAGARGALLIGMRNHARLLTLMLPPRRDPELMLALLRANAEQLRRLGADGFIHVHRARLAASGRKPMPAVIVHERVVTNEARYAYRHIGGGDLVAERVGLHDRMASALRDAIPLQCLAEAE